MPTPWKKFGKTLSTQWLITESSLAIPMDLVTLRSFLSSSLCYKILCHKIVLVCCRNPQLQVMTATTEQWNSSDETLSERWFNTSNSSTPLWSSTSSSSTAQWFNTSNFSITPVELITVPFITVIPSLECNLTQVTQEPVLEEWKMSYGLFLGVVLVLTLILIIAMCSNVLLIVTIWRSPSLKTPPNAHLVNICVNNLTLCVAGLFGLLSLVCSYFNTGPKVVAVFGHIRLFLTPVCFLQYWIIFAAISHYRCRTIKLPSLSLKTRRQLIGRTIVFGWLFASTAGLAAVFAFRVQLSAMGWNGFRTHMKQLQSPGFEPINSGQKAVLVLMLSGILGACLIMVYSYYWIFRTLLDCKPICSSRVTPWTRAASLSSDGEYRQIAPYTVHSYIHFFYNSDLFWDHMW